MQICMTRRASLATLPHQPTHDKTIRRSSEGRGWLAVDMPRLVIGCSMARGLGLLAVDEPPCYNDDQLFVQVAAVCS